MASPRATKRLASSSPPLPPPRPTSSLRPRVPRGGQAPGAPARGRGHPARVLLSAGASLSFPRRGRARGGRGSCARRGSLACLWKETGRGERSEKRLQCLFVSTTSGRETARENAEETWTTRRGSELSSECGFVRFASLASSAGRLPPASAWHSSLSLSSFDRTTHAPRTGRQGRQATALRSNCEWDKEREARTEKLRRSREDDGKREGGGRGGGGGGGALWCVSGPVRRGGYRKGERREEWHWVALGRASRRACARVPSALWRSAAQWRE
ncbi:hypothetical protein DMC30DRAFT_445274 [Rhodotorula diobovata]|uniref:Uncharacterized protein n=1 Tax=Rhodotorula diobovata TaxID=5288 RepID=A0A5C5G3H2_9BASI|nr:hypothetical protein DMC30DRAFT_445274 [Rhodotorula diobovata]